MEKLISIQELEERAKMNVRNYEGAPARRNPYELGRNYDGLAPQAIAPALGSFTMTIVNNGSAAVDQSIALLPAYFTDKTQVKNSAGVAVAAIVAEGQIISTANAVVTATGKPKSINEFLAFVKLNPVRITGMKIKVDDSSQFVNDILFRKESPLKDLGYITKSPANYQNSMQNNDKIVEIPLTDAQFDNQTSVVTTIGAGRTMTITFFIGAIRNEAAMLDAAVKSASGQY